MEVGYVENYILLTADNPAENQQIMNCLNSAGLFSRNAIQYNKDGIWKISEKFVSQINQALIPLKSNIRTTKEFQSWIAEHLRNNHPAKHDDFIIECGVVKSKIIANPVDIPHKDLAKAMRYFFMGAQRMQIFINKQWDGYINLYDRRSRTFPTGLLYECLQVLEQHSIRYKVKTVYDKTIPKQFDWTVNDGITPDPDQEEAIKAGLKGKRGIIKAPTGFGKTAVLAKRLVAGFGVPSLFIANKKLLLDDAATEFLDGIAGLDKVNQIKDGYYGDAKVSGKGDVTQLDAPVVVATIQSLHARLKDPKTSGLLRDWLQNTCKFVMVDECQAVGTKMWDEVLNLINAPYRIMLSATPRRTDGATIKIKAASGPVLFSTTAEQQIQKNRLCELEILFHKFDHHMYNENDANLEYAQCYKDHIVYNEKRNDLICSLADSMVQEERNVLVLVVSIDHGHILKDKFLKMGYSPDSIRLVWGDTSTKKRQEAIDDFRAGKYNILIGSTIFDAGANIPGIAGIVLAGAGKADITLIQRIGRAARNCDYQKAFGRIPRFMQGKDRKQSIIYDILDTNVCFFRKQARHRFYNASEEFGADRVRLVGATKKDLYAPKKKTQAENIESMTFNVGGKKATLEEIGALLKES